MENAQLISIDDDSLDQVAGGGWTFSITVPHVGEVVEEVVETAGGILGAAASGVGGLLGLFGFSVRH